MSASEDTAGGDLHPEEIDDEDEQKQDMKKVLESPAHDVEEVIQELKSFAVSPVDPLISQSVYSPLGTPFLVVGGSSSLPFIASIAPPSPVDFEAVKAECDRVVEDWVDRRVVLLCDFEGENMGWGGDLTMAQFLETDCVDAERMEFVSAASAPNPSSVGLLVHSKCDFGKELIKRVMESESVTKLIWGADSDLASLRYQLDLPSIRSQSVIDVQLCFSEKKKRMGMGRMLEHVRRINPVAVGKLPEKEHGEFYFLPR